MKEYLIKEESLIAIGDEIRELNEVSGVLTPDQMIDNLDSANRIIQQQAETIQQISQALVGKGLENNSIPEVAQATPTISVSSSGLITASATQTAGKVAAGTKTATEQLTTQAATTYTPSTSNQTIAAGTYCSGVQTIKGDSNLIASNIKSGVSIFGVNGTVQTSSVQTKSGTFRVSNGSATINCGFQPDAIEIIICDNCSGVDYNGAAIFTRSSRKKDLVIWDENDDSYPIGWMYVSRTSTGVSITSFEWNSTSWDSYSANNSYSYYAVKYT